MKYYELKLHFSTKVAKAEAVVSYWKYSQQKHTAFASILFGLNLHSN